MDRTGRPCVNISLSSRVMNVILLYSQKLLAAGACIVQCWVVYNPTVFLRKGVSPCAADQ